MGDLGRENIITMQKVSLRDFSLQPTKWLKQLPIVLTRYNLPIATVIPHKQPTLKEQNQMYSGIKTDPASFPPKKIVIETPSLADKSTIVSISREGHCQPPNGVCRQYGKLYLVAVPTEEGYRKKELYLCSFHLTKAKAECDSVEEV